MTCFSKCVVSRKGPIWVAAFCFKKLKKSHVKDTDISSSVDKILRNEMNFDSYRVLSYLLLGVIRIYSKKVEYLYDDCNEVLIKIKKFTVHTEKSAPKETLRMSITVPDRFELDAFDLEIVEDVDGGNIARKEDITLKDVLWKDEGIGQFSLDKYLYEEFDFCQNTCSADPLIFEDLQLSQPMDNYEASRSNSTIEVLSGKYKFQNGLLSQEESVNLDPIPGVEGVPTEPMKLFSQGQQINKEHTFAEGASDEDNMLEERRLENIISHVISQEKLEDNRMFTRREEETEVSVASHQGGEDCIKVSETANSDSQIYHEIEEVYVARISSPRSMEGFQDDKCNRKECLEYGRSPSANEKIEKLMAEFVEKHNDVCKLNSLEKVSSKDRKFDEEKNKINETANSECQMHLEMEEDHEAMDSPVSMERLQDDIFDRNDSMNPDKSSSVKEKIEKLIEGPVEKHHKKGRFKLQEISIEAVKFCMTPSDSNILDVTPQTKFRSASVAKRKRGATTPESVRIYTPAVKERAPFSRKRKCVFDGLIVLPNEVLRQSIRDASDLISKRRKVPRPVLGASNIPLVSSLPEGFYQSLLPCPSLELQMLFSGKRIKTLNSIEIAESPEWLDESEPQTVDKLDLSEPVPDTPPVPQCSTSRDLSEAAPKTPPQCSTSRDRNEAAPITPPQCSTSRDLSEAAPKTPPQCSTSRLNYFQGSITTQKSDNIRPLSLLEYVERDKTLKMDEELRLVEEGDVETSSQHASTAGEQYFRKDEELDLIFEETDSIETENLDLCGWSRRTMKVAKYLQRHFLDLKKQREEEVLNFSQVLLGRAKKESARLFYEILVLLSLK